MWSHSLPENTLQLLCSESHLFCICTIACGCGCFPSSSQCTVVMVLFHLPGVLFQVFAWHFEHSFWNTIHFQLSCPFSIGLSLYWLVGIFCRLDSSDISISRLSLTTFFSFESVLSKGFLYLSHSWSQVFLLRWVKILSFVWMAWNRGYHFVPWHPNVLAHFVFLQLTERHKSILCRLCL